MELARGSDPEPAGPVPARRSLFRRESVSIAELGVQTFAVVLGILLALAIDDWRKERETRESTAAAMNAVRAELEANREQAGETHERLHALVAALADDEKAGADTQKPCNEYKDWDGIGVPLLLDAAYETTIATQVFAHTDFGRAQSIAEAYGLQHIYLDERNRVVDLLLRAQPLPIGFCRGVVDELAHLNDKTETAYAKAIAAAQG